MSQARRCLCQAPDAPYASQQSALDIPQHMHAQACSVVVVSTFPPKHCGLATFSAALLRALRGHPGLPPGGCAFGVIAIVDPADDDAHAATDPAVVYRLRLDKRHPSPAMLQAVHFIHKAGYSHVVIQQARLCPATGMHLAGQHIATDPLGTHVVENCKYAGQMLQIRQ